MADTDAIRWSALTVLALVAAMLAFACDGRSAEGPDGTTTTGHPFVTAELETRTVSGT